MAHGSRERVREARKREPEGALLRRALETPRPPPLRLREFDVIAELKYRSPAAGRLARASFDGDRQVRAYAAAGAAAVSILTEPDEFRGSLDDLRRAAALLVEYAVPAMRKDFLADPYQVFEARAAGAGGVLVIVTMLDDTEVADLLAAARECGLFVLLEGFDEYDLDRIGGLVTAGGSVQPGGSPPLGGSTLPGDSVTPGSSAPPGGSSPPDRTAPPILCGVNCRDLRDLEVSFARFRQLAPYLPPHLPAVAESGITGVGDIAAVARLGFRAALVGSALMRSADAAGEVTAMIGAGTQALEALPCS